MLHHTSFVCMIATCDPHEREKRNNRDVFRHGFSDTHPFLSQTFRHVQIMYAYSQAIQLPKPNHIPLHWASSLMQRSCANFPHTSHCLLRRRFAPQPRNRNRHVNRHLVSCIDDAEVEPLRRFRNEHRRDEKLSCRGKEAGGQQEPSPPSSSGALDPWVPAP
jgi:hypothetical protein